MRKPLRIMAILHSSEFGGPHNQLLRLTKPLLQHDWSLVVILPSGNGSDRLELGELRVIRIALSRIRASKDPILHIKMMVRLPIDLVQLWRSFRCERPDVVQLSSLMNPHAAYVARAMGIPVVWQIVDTRPPMMLRRVMMVQIKWLADVVMPIGAAVREAHPGADDFGQRCVLFFPPVDLNEFRPDGQSALRQELGIPETSLVVSVIGNINPQKGHEYFLQAATKVFQKHPGAVFVIAGHLYENHREYYERLVSQAQADGLELGRELHFLGSRTDIPNILRASDVLALASVPNSEGMPTVILEAMGCGVPVVVSDVAAVSEAVADGETGFVVPSLDVDAMAARLNQLLDDEELRRAFGKAGRTRAEEHFSLDQYVDSHLRAYDLAITNNAKRRRLPWQSRESHA